MTYQTPPPHHLVPYPDRLTEDYDAFDWLLDCNPIALAELAREYLARINSLEREKARTQPFAVICSDLDRCVHGRHSSDDCWGCKGRSKGNLFIPPPGQQMGNTLSGKPIVHPVTAKRHLPEAWTPYGL
jgi:hypothetical protein